jgi:SAM-dependent methyltransferase
VSAFVERSLCVILAGEVEGVDLAHSTYTYLGTHNVKNIRRDSEMSKLFTKPLESFKGRHIGCAPGTHAAIASMISSHLKPSGNLLDIGAHSGALLLRLEELGFTQLTGIDLDPTRFDVPGADFKILELNEPFACYFDRRFQLVAATDVIEHLDSPRNFLKEVHQLLEDDGWIVISLPNIASWEGRLKFFFNGELWQFREINYREQRHISPISREQMIMMMQELGFRVAALGSAGSFSTRFKKILTFPIWLLAAGLRGMPTSGASAIFLAQKSTPDHELTCPTHYKDRWKGTPDCIGIEAS